MRLTQTAYCVSVTWHHNTLLTLATMTKPRFHNGGVIAHYQSSYEPRAAEDSWERTTTFLACYLTVSRSG